jgi:hypothetical protein
MKKYISQVGILVLAGLLTVGIAQSAKANLIVNGGFETGAFDGWTQANSAATVAMTSSISPCCLTSPRQNIAVLARSRRAFTVAAPSGSFRPSTQTRAPSWAKTPAMPLPMPLVPPVTMTDLFLIDVSRESSLFVRSASVSGGLFSCVFTARLSNHCRCPKRALISCTSKVQLSGGLPSLSHALSHGRVSWQLC